MKTTSFSTGNQTILGSSNTRMGYFTGMLSGYSNAVFGDQSLQNCTGNSNTAIGHNSQNSNTSYSFNTSLGSNSDITGGHSNVAIGNGAQCSNCSDSVALGINVTCNTNNQILLGSSSHTVKIPGNLSCEGLLSANVINTSGDLSCYGLLSANVINTSGNLSCYGLLSANVVNTSGNLSCNGLISGNGLSTGSITFSETLNNISTTTFGFLAGVTSSIQSQINNSNSNISTIENRTRDISWTSGQINKTTINNQCETSTLSFSQTLNSISATTFGFLSGVTSSIQNQINSLQTQINALSNNTPAGMVIAYAGSSSSLSGYLLCDGSIYNSANYSALYNAIGTIYGDAGNGNFRVPDYRAVFLRGAGQQDVQLQIIAGNGGPIFKNFQAPALGHTVTDQSTYFSTNNFVNDIQTEVKSVVTGSSAYVGTFPYTNAISKLTFTTSNNIYNFGNEETHPVHASVQYFIKY